MKLTTYQKLRKYESYLYTAKYANFARGLTNKQIEDLITAGNDINIIYKNNHCPDCILRFLKRLAEPYFEFKTKMENNKEKKDKKKDKDGNK